MFSLTRTTASWISLVVFASFVVASPSIAGDLTSYSLPSQQRYVPERRVPEQRAPAATDISEAYYQQFAEKGSALRPSQRADLQRNFMQRREQAYAAGKVDEAQHYNRLVQILSSLK